MFFRKHLKSYLPKKNPGYHYTSNEIENAYVDILNDSNNDVAKFLRTLLPNHTIEDLSKYFRVIFGKLSWYDHTLIDAMKICETSERLISFIQSIPAILTIDEKLIVEKLSKAYLKFDEDYKKFTKYNY